MTCLAVCVCVCVCRSEDGKTGLALYKNFKRLGATWDNSNNAA